jgi:tetratricopeptide (TPR) repeat protein
MPDFPYLHLPFLSEAASVISVFRPTRPVFNHLLWSVFVICVLGNTFFQSALAIDLPGGLSVGGLAKEETTMENGIHLYQEGQYPKASKILDAIHKEDPANLKVTYYLAMTHAQLGHYAQARKLYQEVAMLDPQGPIGHYAKEGLQYLPTQDGRLDPPPRFQAAVVHPAASPSNQAQTGISPIQQNAVQQPVNPNQAMAEANGMSLQEWQSLQMMLGNGNNNNSNSMNNMLPFMMGQGHGQGQSQTLDPNIMSTLMMNQMMQNMDLGSGNNNNNN